MTEGIDPLQAQMLAPFATEIAAIDDTTLDPMRKHLPAIWAVPAGDKRLLPGKLASVFDVRRQVWRTVEYVANTRSSERVLTRELTAQVQPGSLVLMDLGYFGFAFIDALTDDGDFWMSRLRTKTSYTAHHTDTQQGDLFDGVIWLGAPGRSRQTCGAPGPGPAAEIQL